MPARDHPYFAPPFTALAHRGGALPDGDTGRENTLEAFTRATELGYTHLETDVHATADGHLVAFHDDVLDRVTDRAGAIADLPLAEVRRARIGGSLQVPTLDEVLDGFPDSFVNIDIKAPAAVEPLVAALEAHQAWERVCVGSFGQRRLTRFRRLAAGRALTSMGPVGVVVARTPGLNRLLSGPGLALQIPESHEVAGRQVRLVTPELLDAAHGHGKVVHVWTVNEADRMRRLIDLGVDGIVTDAVDVLRRVLQQRGLWHGQEHVHDQDQQGEQNWPPIR